MCAQMDQSYKGTVDLNKLEDELKRLKVENQYMRLAFDILRKNIIIRDEKPQMELKLPDILMDDQELIDLTTSVTDASGKFYSLEMELDNLYRQISQLTTMIDGIEQNNDTESFMKNNVEATARKPRYTHPKMTDQSQQCLKLEKDFELMTSAWRCMKEKERDIKRLEDENKCLEYLLSYLHKHMSTDPEKNCVSFQPPSEFPPDSAVARSYKAVQAIWIKLSRMKRNQDKTKKKNTKLLRSVDDMNRCLSQNKEAVLDLQNRIKYLESDLESKNNINMELQIRHEELQRRIQQLSDEMKKFETTFQDQKDLYTAIKGVCILDKDLLMQAEDKEKKLLMDLERSNAVNKQLHDECRSLQRLTEQMCDEMEKLKTNFQTQKDINRVTHTKWKEDKELLQKETISGKQLLSKLERNTTENKKLNNYCHTLQRRIEQMSGEMTQCHKNFQIQKDLNAIIDEKWKSDRELLHKSTYRLSKLVGERLVHENTNITDLSDPNRPTKLAEAYSELYDNEWTDAFEELTSQNIAEKEVIKKLLMMLMMSFHKCRQITWQRYQSLQTIVSTIDIHGIDLVRELPEHLICTTRMTFDQEKEIKSIWRTTTTALRDEAVKHLYSALLTTFDIPIDNFPNTSKYLSICIDLCWKMGIQEKPMYLDEVAETSDGSKTILDVSKFRCYTKTGKKVAFVVWPVMLLHEGGPMLVKGIAQGCLETEV